MKEIERNTLVLGVTGSIAAYKAADLCSKVKQAGIPTEVLMTESAQKLISAQTFFTLSQAPVICDLWNISDWRPGDISLAERCKVLLIAPATANILAKMANGIADDALSTFYLSHTEAVIVAPAMNPRMWEHPATQNNCRILRERGVIFIGPDSGNVACGKAGKGRMAAVEEIFRKVKKFF